MIISGAAAGNFYKIILRGLNRDFNGKYDLVMLTMWESLGKL